MEAIFCYISFDYELRDINVEPIGDENIPTVGYDSRPEEIYQPVSSNRSQYQTGQLIIKKNRTRKRDVLYSVFSTTAKVATVGYKGVSSFAQGVTQLVRSGPARPSWNSGTHMVLHWLRDALRFEHNSIEAVRRGELVAGSIISLTTSNVSIVHTSFEVIKSKLMAYEKDGRSFQASTQSWRYPVPAEDPTHIRDCKVLTLNGEWIIPLEKTEEPNMLFSRFFARSSSRKKCILYLHGGCYIIGTAQIYRNLTSLLAKNNNCPVFALNYRLAPEHPFPAGLNDALAAYIWLLNPKNPMFNGSSSDVLHQAFSAEDIIICGDSAGGGLTMALLNYLNMYLRNSTGELLVPFPRGAILLSPWVDLSCSSQSWEDNKGLDFLPAEATDLHTPVALNVQHPVYSYCFGSGHGRNVEVLSPKGTTMPFRIPSIVGISTLAGRVLSDSRRKDEEWIKNNLGDAERDALERFVRHPLVSPVFGDFKGLPPILIQVGDCELLRDETIALAFKYKSHNLNSLTSWVRHELYHDMIHDFQVASAFLPAAKLSVVQISRFIDKLFNDEIEHNLILSKSEKNLIKLIDSHSEYIAGNSQNL